MRDQRRVGNVMTDKANWKKEGQLKYNKQTDDSDKRNFAKDTVCDRLSPTTGKFVLCCSRVPFSKRYR